MINIIGEIIEKHSDEEITAHLEKIVAGVVKNYTVALDKGNSDILWANLGDLTQVASILRGMRKRNEARKAQKES